MYKILTGVLFLLLTADIHTALSQATGVETPAGGTAPAGGTGQAPSPLDFPEYIITPGEDLNQFENTRVKKTKTDYREGQSSLNKSISQKSNAEINAEIQKRREERIKAAEKEAEAVQKAVQGEGEVPEDTGATADTGGGYVTPGGQTSLLKWKDKDGVIHVTDDIYSVPPEYRDQVMNN